MKYKNKKTSVNVGGKLCKFDSKVEAERACYLNLLQRANEIYDLEFQPVYMLQEGFRRNGVKHRDIKYLADFRYNQDGLIVVEDVKSPATLTPLYSVKKKMFLLRYGNDLIFKEVMKKRKSWEVKTI